MDWTNLLVSWLPFLLLIGVWIFFMRKMRDANSPQQRALAEQRRHNDVLEKILASHEARLQKIEDKRT
jgi:ATP-dependent Zn protease